MKASKKMVPDLSIDWHMCSLQFRIEKFREKLHAVTLSSGGVKFQKLVNMSSPSYGEVERFLKNENYPGQFDVSTKDLQKFEIGLPLGLKAFYVNGSPIECTIECDYSTVNVSGSYHRIYIVGICNQVNLTGTFHSLFFDGFSNQVNFCADVQGGQICVQGISPYSHAIGVNTGQITTEGTAKPTKLEFCSKLNNSQRRRLRWRPASCANEKDENKNDEKGVEEDDENM